MEDLTPTDIRQRSFAQSLRGIDRDEVTAFLHRIADEVETLTESRDRLRDRVEHLEDKLEKIGDATGKIRSAKSRLDERRSRIETEEKRLAEKRKDVAEKERAVEQQREAVLELVARLQGVMTREVNNLQSLTGGDRTDATGARSGASGSESAPQNDDQNDVPSPKKRKKSTQEWIDSLFPNRLGAGKESGDGAASSTSSPSPSPSKNTGRRSESQSQFEAIKQDVKNRNSSSSPDGSAPKTSNSPHEPSDEPSTSELHRIWDIFEK